MLKVYNEYELRFLQILVDKKRHDVITHMQTVQGMRGKKVFILGDNEGLMFEKKKSYYQSKKSL